MAGGTHGKPSAGSEIVGAVIFRQYANDGGNGLIGQSLLQSPEHVLGLRCFDAGKKVRINAEGGKAGRIKAPPSALLVRGERPQYMARAA